MESVRCDLNATCGAQRRWRAADPPLDGLALGHVEVLRRQPALVTLRHPLAVDLLGITITCKFTICVLSEWEESAGDM